MKKRIIALLQLALGVGLILYLFMRMKEKGDLGKMREVVSTAAGNWLLLAAGTLGFFACIFLCAVRWKMLLSSQGLKVPMGRVLSLYFTGHFFSTFLPGVTGGDIVKAYFAAKEAPHMKTAAVSTVVMDRIIGLLALVMLAVAVMLARLPFFLAYPQMKTALVFNVCLFAAMSIALFVVFRQNLFERWDLFRRLEQKTRLGEIIGKAYNACHVSLTHPGLLVKTILLSLVNHVVFILCQFLIGLGLGINISLLNCLTAFLIINAVAAIPITPGGLGTREATSIYLLSVFGIAAAPAISISLLTYAMIVFWGAVGGVVYMFYIYSRPKAAEGAGSRE